MPPWTLLSRRRKSVQVTPQAGNSGSGDSGSGDLNARAPVTGGFPEAAPRLLDGTLFIGGETEQRRHAKQTGEADGDDDSKSARRVSRTAASNGTQRDRLRLFRSRSTHFDLGGSGAGSEGGEPTGGSSGIARRSTIASLYFPQTSLAATTTTPPSSSASPETPAVTTAHREARVGSPDEGRVTIGTGTGTGTETGRKTPQTGPTVIGESVKQAGGRLQRQLKRLPSLTLRRGLSWRGNRLSKAPPAGIGKPGTVLSQPSPPNSTPRDSSVHSRQALRPPVNPNKPLPPTPASESQLGGSADDLNRITTTTTTTTASITTNPRTTTPPTTASNPPVTLLRINRIMATLSALDIEKLFSGAPQYFARSEGHFTGAPHPSVAFPWDEELAIRDLTDHTQIEDEAWGCITAWPHITKDVRRGPSQSATREVAKRRRAHFYPRCRERPSMLSMQGLEKGTIGYQAALELGVADALQEEQWGFGSLGAKDRVVVDARKHLIASKDGLRRLEETAVLDHLIKNAQRYQETHRKDKASCHELFNELFSQILHQPSKTFTDPFSLSTQIQSLLKVLATPNVWIDFSHVEWRIRLGQILWGTADDDSDDSVSDGASIAEAENTQGMHEERYWLLLQILLACELIIRLDTLTEGDEIADSIKPSEIQRFERTANSSVKWSLHLARAWLENIEVTKTKQSTDGEEEQPKGWLANLTHRMSLTHERPHSRHHERHHDHHKQNYIYVMKGKYWERQVHGLTHFAKRLKWPDIESQSRLITDNCRAVTDGTPITTPLETPLSTLTGKSKTSSYFASRKDITLGKKQERRQRVGAALHPAGWLSKSYVSGLMLPGEGLYHFLMSTLLENDVVAMSKLGPVANLCGGFVYSGKSFWSTACIVGRVLAAGKGAVECMGWISSDVIPRALQDGWVDIDVEDIPEDVKKTGKQSRIWGKLAIERESSILGGSDPHSIFPADFIIPYENHYKTPPPTLSVELRSLDLTEPLDSVTTTPTVEVSSTPSEISAIPAIKTFTPAMTFNVTTWENDDDREYTIPISKDVYFVTAHPCVPSQHVRILKSPSSPTIQQIDLTGHPVPGPGKFNGHAKITCHPLHKFYTYTPIHLSELLTKSTWTLDQLLQNVSSEVSPSITPSLNNTRTPRVLVIDAITNFVPQPEAHEIPLSPITSRTSTNMSDISISSRQSSISSVASPDTESGFPGLQRVDTDRTGGSGGGNGGAAEQQMHSESRRRQFGSDMEILVRALCAERGWNALISRRRRGCLACAIREAGAIGWKVVIRVD